MKQTAQASVAADGAAAGGSTSRQARWSVTITAPLAGAIPAADRHQALAAIKAIHTAIFLSVAGAVLLTLWDGLTGRPRRRTAIAGGVVAAETALYITNNQVCPLTPLAEELGASTGSVVDLFLPMWAAKRIPAVAGTAAIAALILNVRAWRESNVRSRLLVSA